MKFGRSTVLSISLLIFFAPAHPFLLSIGSGHEWTT